MSIRPNFSKKLLAKGWDKKNIERTFSILEKAQQEKPRHYTLMDKALFWIIVFMIFLTHFFVSLLLFPLLYGLIYWQIILILIGMGILVGFISFSLVTSVEHHTKKHHLHLGIITTIIALGMIVSAALFLRFLTQTYHLVLPPTPLLFVGIAYTLSYTLSYFFLFLRKHSSAP